MNASKVDYSDAARAILLSKVYESVYSDGSLFADVELLRKNILKTIHSPIVGDDFYTCFCGEELVDDIEKTIDDAIDAKLSDRAKANRASKLALCSYIVSDSRLDCKYVLSIISQMLKSPTDLDKLHRKFREELSDCLSYMMVTDIYRFSNTNYKGLGYLNMFWNKDEQFRGCRSRTFLP